MNNYEEVTPASMAATNADITGVLIPDACF